MPRSTSRSRRRSAGRKQSKRQRSRKRPRQLSLLTLAPAVLPARAPTTFSRWTASEVSYLRKHYHTRPACRIARHLGISVSRVYTKANALKISHQRLPIVGAREQLVYDLYDRGWTDKEIAAELGVERHTILRLREFFGLPSNKFSPRQLIKIRARTAEQMRRLGVANICVFRWSKYRKMAVERGWPGDLKPTAFRILDLLYSHGPMTRREIVAALGLPWKGSSKSLCSNDPEGSYLANLMARGLVVSLGRIVKGQGKGKSVQLYTVPLSVEPGQF